MNLSENLSRKLLRVADSIQRPDTVAKTAVATFWADCGECGESLSDPDTGSQMLEANKEYPLLTCSYCGALNKLNPKNFWKGISRSL